MFGEVRVDEGLGVETEGGVGDIGGVGVAFSFRSDWRLAITALTLTFPPSCVSASRPIVSFLFGYVLLCFLVLRFLHSFRM